MGRRKADVFGPRHVLLFEEGDSPSQFNRSGEAIGGCGRAASFFRKHVCAGDWGLLDAADGGERENTQAYFSGDQRSISQKGRADRLGKLVPDTA